MNVTDPIADLLTRIRNALLASKTEVSIPRSNIKLAIAHLLQNEGYVEAVEMDRTGHQGQIKVQLRYWKDELPVISGIRRISRPGRRKYVKAAEIPKVLGGLGICILSTSQGVMTGHQASKANVGGELLCEVW